MLRPCRRWLRKPCAISSATNSPRPTWSPPAFGKQPTTSRSTGTSQTIPIHITGPGSSDFMKRRAFIGLLGASALSMPFILGQNGLGLGRRNARVIAYKNRIPLPLTLPEDAAQVAGLLGARSRSVYLLGGTALAAAAGTGSTYLNLMIEARKLPELKKALFDFGVTPVSTADLSPNFIRFVHQGKAYNVLNLSFDSYAQLSADGMEKGLILFAHNFLICSLKAGWAVDPYGALDSKAADQKTFSIKPLQQPKTLLQGFEHCLAATFDASLLGLKSSPEYQQLEERVFHSTPNAQESKEIMSLLLDYSTDILEVAGLETDRKSVV